MIIQCFDQECERYQKWGTKGSFYCFLDPSSSRLASGSPGPSNDFRLKEPARLGEPITSWVSLSSLGWAAIAPSAHFPINKRAREAEERFQGLEGGGIERREKEEEEERRGNEAETLPNRDRDHSLLCFLVLCFSCDRRLVLFLRIECDLCILRGPPCYYLHIHLLHLSSTISFFFVKFNLNRSLML